MRVLNIQLTDYQVDAIEKMHNGCILRGGTGAGKTLTSLVHVYEKFLEDRPLISWAMPMHELPLMQSVHVITTPKKRDSCDWTSESALVPLILAGVDSWNNIKKYENIKNSIFIFDESKVIGYGHGLSHFLK